MGAACNSMGSAVGGMDMLDLQALVANKRSLEPVQEIGCLQSSITSCCCLRIQPRDSAPEYLLKAEETGPPSLFMRLCTCQCSSEQRQRSRIEDVRELAGLAGITLQYGDHTTAGSLETLKWGTFDKEKRTLDLTVFGGFYSHWSTGIWTEPTAPLSRSAMWCCLMNLARVANYSYRFEFSEDYRSAKLKISGNPLVFCCCCCPFIPAWFTIPQSCNEQYMEQADDSRYGTHWKRYCGLCSRPASFYYDLITVYDINGSPTRDNDKLLEKTNQQVMVSY